MIKRILKSFIFTFLFLIFFSCSSAPSLRVPGESAVISKNLAIEYFNIAEGYTELKKYDKAAEYYKKALSDKNLYSQAYYKLARSYALAKNWDDAATCYEELLTLDPENEELKESLAYISAMKGDFDDAISRYETLTAQYPFNQSLLENYIAMLIQNDFGEEAEKQLALLKEKFPDSEKITAYAGKIEDLTGKSDSPDSVLENADVKK